MSDMNHITSTTSHDPSERTRRPVRRRLAVAAVATAAVVAPSASASADQAYHTYHAPLEVLGDEPLKHGFVNNIHTQGPTVYAMEYYHLVGARPGTTYTALISFHIADPDCSEPASFVLPSAEITTNAAGNGHGASAKFTPDDVAPLRGAEHGVNWVIVDAGGEAVFQSGCSPDFLD